ncbi:MAG: TlyA family rRNA (cytidine-2'-O)-methyltransferase [Candidatus Reconcilbacillus cellulovorans]|uniref:TlyA family rRNA (Cytidine-2'-O)-methyltransferase n=1 Tax=Candidatus Reconcilbacillus cellulovorans TaxID=1906605 RepID=A0A2A6E0M7_9BACL|nr:MAG: TlyA family rRNA (cytidine-2'-O)-methyltransferase [Candidatus Reconcilbacillus cellulovorans]
MGASKERLDVLLVQGGWFSTREKAKAAVMAGIVFVDGQRAEKPGVRVPRDASITVRGEPHPYVGRGGLKLEKALREFGIDLTGRVVIDVGASTGGFTDCALKHGAVFVYAVDVGYNQLDWSLRNDPRVRVMERTNFRYAKPEDFSGPRPDFGTVDVSFISLRLILPPLAEVLKDSGEAVALVKPQFEAGRGSVGKSGVVRDARVHVEILEKVLAQAEDVGFFLKGLTFSPITGGDGNIEFLAYWTKDRADPGVRTPPHGERIASVVGEAWRALANGS